MPFAHDTEVALQYAAALVNTRPTEASPETLTTVSGLLEQMEGFGWTGSMPDSEAEIATVRRVRARLRRFWDAELDEAVELTNALLRDGRALPQLVNHEPFGWHIHAAEPSTPVSVRIAVDTAMAVVDLIRAGELDRLQVCTAPDCDDVFVDLTKNRSRKFCDGTCGTKAAVAAYRARQRAAKGD